MNAQRMDQEAVERLLAGRAVDSGNGAGALLRLLAALRAAARPAELRGESAALDAYRAARERSPAPPATHAGRRTPAAPVPSVRPSRPAVAPLSFAPAGPVAADAPLLGRSGPAA
ncbi:hypothetical protein ACFY2R_04240 [Micromonospora olivasterospora]|uniref:Uncharacterized protein n=1 Tax=Micromonospora olivasterospora TaxID=1880 RepID=A0A562IE01_MICOL|nr:hypothetical protein [Micromonospora olivasterospora]TWH69231.1 hypothetical protein JD77_04239 [Micromonospora olivasterospora]